jgi:formylglycine-generating enzyme required for sulfatase activity
MSYWPLSKAKVVLVALLRIGWSIERLSAPHWLDALTRPLEKHLHRLGETVAVLLPRMRKDAPPETETAAISSAGPLESAERLSEEITNTIGMKLHLIRPGTFRMGSESPQARQDEQPAHQVTITKPFYIGVYEVTQAEYEAVMGTNPSNFKGARRPVETVSWNDAGEFCRKLSAKEGTTYRLPTEAEWEYACRAGSTTEYCFGDDESRLSEYAWYSANSGSQTHDVGQRKPNAWGLYDMHGNVWEWCEDWYAAYTAGSQVDPVGPSSSRVRVIRGGSWNLNASYCRSAYRGLYTPGDRGYNIGFRFVRTQK